MAALPYMQLYVADYLADTAYLDVVESGAYLHLLMNYWQTGKPLPDDDAKLARIARCTEEQWFNVRSTVVGYFVEQEGQLIHQRVERDLEKVRSKIEKASEAGRKSAESRKNNKESNSSSTDVQRTFNGRSNERYPKRSTTQDTDTDNRKECRVALDYLNRKAGRKFRSTERNLGFITARLNEGMSLEQLKQVVNTKVAQWGDDERMSEYLRPETLFGPKCESYLLAAKPTPVREML